MSKKLLAFAAVFLPTLGACTALLGSYEVGPAAAVATEGGGGDDAGGDVTAAETGPTEGGDGEAGAEGGASLLKCSLGTTNPRTLDTGPLNQTLYAFGIGNGQNRVIGIKNGQGVVVYTYDRSNTGTNPQITLLPKIGQVLSVRRLANGIGILSLDVATPPATGTSIGVSIIDDATGVASRTTFKLVAATNQGSGAFALLGSEYLFAYGDATTGTIQAGRFVPGGGAPVMLTVASGVSGGAGTVKSVEVANAKMYIFNDVGPDASSGNASSGYYVLDDAVTTVGPLVSLGSGVAGKAAFLITADSALFNFQVAVADLDLANGTPPAVLHLGSVPVAKASNFNVVDIPSAYTFDTLLDTPFGDHISARFQGTDFIAMGSNPNKDPGLNFVWYDTKTNGLRASNGNGNKLLPLRMVSAVSTILTQSTGILANFDVVWLENASGDPNATMPATLYTAEMSCFK